MNERPCLIDGREYDCGFMPEGLYVFQNIRTAGVQAAEAARHAEILDLAAREVLGRNDSTDSRALAADIENLLRRNNYPSGALSYVTVRRYMGGELTVSAREIFPYGRRQLRMIFPRAAVCDYDLPFGEWPTSLSESADETARAAVRKACPDVRTVVRRSSGGAILSADGAPLFIVEGGQIVSPVPQVPSAEFESVAAAARKAGIPFTADAIDTERLLAADELFFADRRGLTAVSSCEGHLYMHLTADRIGGLY